MSALRQFLLAELLISEVGIKNKLKNWRDGNRPIMVVNRSI